MFTKLPCGHVVSVEKLQMAGGCPDCMQDDDQEELRLMTYSEDWMFKHDYESYEDLKEEAREIDRKNAKYEVERLRNIHPACVQCTGYWNNVCHRCPVMKKN